MSQLESVKKAAVSKVEEPARKIVVTAKRYPMRVFSQHILVLPGRPSEVTLDSWVQVQLDAGNLVEVT